MTARVPLAVAMRVPFERMEADLRVEAAELDRLDEVLRRERDALGAGLGDGIAGIAAEKERHAKALAQLAERRLATLPFAGRRMRMDDILEQGSAGEGLRRAWAHVRDKARAVQQLNRTNGKLLAQHMRTLHGRLAALATASSPAPTYGPDGTSAPRHASRRLGAA